MLENIVAHSLQVCRVSLLLTDHLGLPGINRELVRAAALLHDITKTRSFQTNENHAETGARLLADLGYPEVARIVGQHVRLDRYPLNSSPPTDAEVVNYSDKRILHDKIVSLNERMGYILERYGGSPERKRNILLLWEKTEKLEKRLFANLPFSPDNISEMLSEGSSARDCQGLSPS
jgi:putative nucleotidyltransferase with HDIG domain